MTLLTLKDWYQLDFALPNALEAKTVLIKINELMVELRAVKLAGFWFFLFEGDTVRVRMQSVNKEGLREKIHKLALTKGLTISSKLPFSDYQEGDEMMFNESFVESFAKIMSEVTKITIKKLKGRTAFDTYRALERLQHCMFNNLATLSNKSEEHFLQQRLLERVRQSFDKDFENYVDGKLQSQKIRLNFISGKNGK